MGKRQSYPRKDFPSYRGRFYVRENRGRAVVETWPRSRPGPRHPDNEFWSQWLVEANLLFKALPEQWREPLRVAARGWPQMPRDLAFASMRGTLWSYTNDEGFTRYPMQAAIKVSESLDVLAQQPGMMLLRGPQIWVPVPPGTITNQVLTWNQIGATAAWAAPTGAGFYTPPLVEDFPTGVNAAGCAWVRAPTTPAVFTRPAPNTTNILNGFVKALPAPSKTYILGCTSTGDVSVDNGPALLVGDSAAGKWLAFTFNRGSLPQHLNIIVERWNSPTSFNSATTAITVIQNGPIFYQLEDNGTNFIFGISCEAAGFRTILTQSRTAWLATPNQLGMGWRNRGNSVAPATAAFIHYGES